MSASDDERDTHFYNLRFYGPYQNIVASFNPLDVNEPNTKHIVGEQEEIIGFYGHLGDSDYPEAFGFIVKSRQ